MLSQLSLNLWLAVRPFSQSGIFRSEDLNEHSLQRGTTSARSKAISLSTQIVIHYPIVRLFLFCSEVISNSHEDNPEASCNMAIHDVAYVYVDSNYKCKSLWYKYHLEPHRCHSRIRCRFFNVLLAIHYSRLSPEHHLAIRQDRLKYLSTWLDPSKEYQVDPYVLVASVP